MNDTDEVLVGFTGCSSAEANVFVSELEIALRETGNGISSTPKKSRPDTQDAGTILSILLDPSLVGAVVSVLVVFLKRNSGAKITITTTTGKAVASNLDSRDAAKIAEALSKATSR